MPIETPEQIKQALVDLITKSAAAYSEKHAALPENLRAVIPTPGELAAKCKGRNGGCRTAKPNKESWAIKYGWRYIRFHAGIDTHLPVLAQFEIADGFKQLEITESPYTGKLASEVASCLDDCAFIAAMLLGYNPLRGVSRWKGLI